MCEFLTDFIAIYELEVARVSSFTQSDQSEVCGECEQPGPVTQFCSDCQNYLCDDCGSQQHKRLKIYRNHEVVSISEVDAATLQSSQSHYCCIHKEEVLKIYCETCEKLVCCDCTLVDHREHRYKFVQDARKLVEAEMASLKSDVEKKCCELNLDLCEIKKVETAVTGYPQVVLADINLFFDNLIQAIEARRKTLVEEVEPVFNKDLKQVWADKEFHETTIAHISGVFGLVEKAMRCTSDSEMILTALQSIRQLRMIKEREWDARAFVKMVASVPSFKKEDVAVDLWGELISDTSVSKELQVAGFEKKGYLYSPFEVTVTCSRIKSLVDKRSGETLKLQRGTLFPQLEVIVLYGRSKKKLKSRFVTMYTIATTKVYVGDRKKGVKGVPKSSSFPKTYKVSITLVCGGEHTAIVRYGNTEMTYTITVKGELRNGGRVKRGPDWGPGAEKRFPDFDSNDDIIGSVQMDSEEDEDEDEDGMVQVRENSGD